MSFESLTGFTGQFREMCDARSQTRVREAGSDRFSPNPKEEEKKKNVFFVTITI